MKKNQNSDDISHLYESKHTANDEKSEKVIWSTANVEKLNLAIEEGYRPKINPFFEGNPMYKKGNIVFEYTKEEIDEITKCSTDVVYFANKYATVMTDRGLLTITLRDYQEVLIRGYKDNRFAICLAARQIGKCLVFNQLVNLSNNTKKSIGSIYYDELKKQRKLKLTEKIKLFLYKLI